MKISKERLRELIKEELSYLEQEARYGRNRQDADDPGEKVQKQDDYQKSLARFESLVNRTFFDLIDPITRLNFSEIPDSKVKSSVLNIVSNFPGFQDKLLSQADVAIANGRDVVQKLLSPEDFKQQRPLALNAFENLANKFKREIELVSGKQLPPQPPPAGIQENIKIKIK